MKFIKIDGEFLNLDQIASIEIKDDKIEIGFSAQKITISADLFAEVRKHIEIEFLDLEFNRQPGGAYGF